jgi:hypothetical protein
LTHPHSAQHVSPIGEKISAYGENEDDLTFTARYVTTKPKATPKYLRIANKTFAIEPCLSSPAKLILPQSNGKDSGGYVEADEYIELLYPSKAETKNSASTAYRITRLTMDEARAYYGVFDSAAEAAASTETYESRIRLAKEKLELSEADAKRKMAEVQQKLVKSEQEVHNLQTQVNELKTSNAAQVELIKERRDTQAHSQRMNMETFKFVATVATSLLALIPLVIKLKSMQEK